MARIMSIDAIWHFSCQQLDDGRWQVNVRGKGRGWTSAQKQFDHPIPALIHTLEQYAGVTDAMSVLREMLGPEPVSMEDLF